MQRSLEQAGDPLPLSRSRSWAATLQIRITTMHRGHVLYSRLRDDARFEAAIARWSTAWSASVWPSCAAKKTLPTAIAACSSAASSPSAATIASHPRRRPHGNRRTVTAESGKPLESGQPDLLPNSMRTNGNLQHRFYPKKCRRVLRRNKGPGIERLLDVRLNNTSQLAGFAKQADLEYFLERFAARLMNMSRCSLPRRKCWMRSKSTREAGKL